MLTQSQGIETMLFHTFVYKGLAMFKVTSCAQFIATALCAKFPPGENDREQLRITIGSHPLALLYKEEASVKETTKKVFNKYCPTLSKDFQDCFCDDSTSQSLRCKTIEQFVKQKYQELSEDQALLLSQTVEKIVGIVIHDVFKHIPQLINAMSVHGFIENTQKVDIDLWRNERHLESTSRPYQLGRPELPSGEIGYINGIMQTFQNAKDDALLLSDNLCGGANIHAIYSATHGALRDLKVLFYGQVGINPEPVHHLLEQWNTFFQRELNSSKRYLQICMSQGAIMVKLALEKLPKKFRQRICVIAIAPAGFIPAKEGCQVRHFVKMTDIVPVAMASGRGRLKIDDPDIIKVASNDGANPHDPHGQNYVDAIEPFVKRFVDTNSILEI